MMMLKPWSVSEKRIPPSGETLPERCRPQNCGHRDDGRFDPAIGCLAKIGPFVTLANGGGPMAGELVIHQITRAALQPPLADAGWYY